MGNNLIYDYLYVKDFVGKLGFILVEKYINTGIKTKMKDIDGYYYKPVIGSLLKGHMPGKFNKNNPYTIQNIKLWLKLNNQPFELISDIYEGNNKKLEWKHLKESCNEVFESSWNCLNQNRGCPYCAGVKVCLSNCLATKNPQLASEWHETLNGELTPYDVTCGSGKDIWWKCKECGHEWESNVLNRTANGNGCPKCSKSKGEKRCKEVFTSNKFVEIMQKEYDKLLNKNNNTYFIPQKTFKELRGLGNGLLSYDFYLPQHNLLIEYQGAFHESQQKNVSKEKFDKQKEHDRRKKEYALSNGYNFLEIWYWEFDNIEEILKKELFLAKNKNK